MSNQSQNLVTIKVPSSYYRLTESMVIKAKARIKEYQLKDTLVKGLYLRIRPSGSKVFYVAKGQQKHSLGDATVLSLKQARSRARILLSTPSDSLSNAIRVNKPISTLESLLEEYFTVNSELSTGYKSNMKQMLRVMNKHSRKPVNLLDTDSILNSFRSARGIFSDATLDTSLNSLTVLLNFSIAKGELERNPTDNIRKRGLRFHINIRSGKLVTESDFKMFFQIIKTPPSGFGISPKNVMEHRKIADTLLFLLLTGCRVGEALGLERRDIYLNSKNERDARGCIKPRTLTFRKTKNGNDHTLQLTPLLNALIVRNMREDCDFIFRHEGVSFNASYSRVIRLISKMGMRPHDLRRTFAYWGAMVMREYEVSIILNHTNKKSSITERYIGDNINKTLGLLHTFQKKVQMFNYTDFEGVRRYGFKNIVDYEFDDEEVMYIKDIKGEQEGAIANYQTFYGL